MQEERKKQVDDYMEWRFGRPDIPKSFIRYNQVYTPMGEGRYKIWRIDSKGGLQCLARARSQ